MIVPMKRAIVLCLAKDKDPALEALRSLGVLHIDPVDAAPAAASQDLRDAEAALEAADAALNLVSSAAGKADPALAANAAPVDLDGAIALSKELSSLESSADLLSRELRRIEPLGEFDPALVRDLAAKGIPVTLFRLAASAPHPVAPDGAMVKALAESGPSRWYALIGGSGDSAPALPEGAERVELPERRLSSVRADIDGNERRRAAILASLAATAKNPAPLAAARAELAARREFAAARDALGANGQVCWLAGYAPAESADSLRAAARENGWGVIVRDPRADENPPTLIRPPKLFRSVATLFSGLGVAPGYTESDVSVPFMCYFSVFFAMLVGDGGYGALILAATLYCWKKFGKNAVAKPWLVLMTVFSIATIAWGLLSNTWFGAGIPACADWPTVKWLGDPSYHNMMLLCFTIGVSHLMLARVWSGVCKINDITCLSEFGWAGVLLTMYMVTNTIVGVFQSFPTWAYWVGGVSVALVFLFTVKPSELKTRGAELGMLPLNIMSALGDIISYVRLFAVGLASVKVAENFNNMATGLLSTENIVLKALLAVAMVAILLIGHGLNFAMAGLSVLVHAVRLNTLEFSNHKGVSWSGYEFNPFRRRA